MIREVREYLRELAEHGGWDTWTYFPEDVNALPCVVVGQPSIQIDAQLYPVTVPVFVVGRRTGTEDAQSEMDETADRIVELLGGTGSDVAVTRIEPDSHTIAGALFPSYRIDVAVGLIKC